MAWFRFSKNHHPRLGALDILKYIGPGLLITVGFIDPGNWAANLAAGSQYGYALLWMVTLATVMLIVLQHNAAHLGIVTGLCLAEAASLHFRPSVSRFFLFTAMAASVATALAELLGAAIGLNMLFNLPIALGALLTLLAVCFVVFTNGYRRIEKWIIAFVSLIGLSFLFELSLVHVAWFDAYKAWFVPAIPPQSLPLIMSVLGAVVMPHNIFLHSEIIQSRQWNLRSEEVIRQQLKYEYADTLIAMIIGWAINSAMIIISAAVFFKNGVQVSELSQGQALLVPFLGKTAALVFAFALLLSGFSSSVTAAIASGSIFAGIYREPLDLQDSHSRVGALIALIGAFGIILLLRGTFDALIWSQVALSIQLPFTVFGLIRLTSSRSVMGKYVNSRIERTVLLLIAVVVTVLNLALLIQTLVGPGSAG